MLTELAAVVPRGDLDDARPARRSQAGPKRALDRGTIQAVHHDLQHRVHTLRELAVDAIPSAERRTVRVVGGRHHVLVFLRADLAAGPDDPAGERQDDAAQLAHRVHRGFRCRESGTLLRGQDQEIAAANRFLNAEGFLDQELALHHGNAPVPLSRQKLARLEAIAEVTQLPADGHSLGRLGQAVEACGGRAREHRLPDAIDELSLKSFGVEAEQQHAHARPKVGCGIGIQFRLDTCLDLAPDDRRGEPGQRLGGRPRPRRRLRRDHHPCRTHTEGLGERVDNPDSVALQNRSTLTHAVQISVQRRRWQGS